MYIKLYYIMDVSTIINQENKNKSMLDKRDLFCKIPYDNKSFSSSN